MSPRLITIGKISSLRERVTNWRKRGETVALVPTMGYLHEGHLSLVRLARKKADRVAVSIFVNPTQFALGEEFKTYPRNVTQDRKKLQRIGADLIFAPAVKEMYATDFSTSVAVSGLTEPLCGASRPGHFAGVATVVAKLLLQALPDIAVFGKKDYQQLLVIKRMVRDLDIPVRIISAPIAREKDGLAQSSRNANLSQAERDIAPLLQRTIKDVAADIANGRSVRGALKAGRERLERGGFRLDYLEARHGATLAPIANGEDQPSLVFAAAFLGKTRLIDNIAIAATPTAKMVK